MGKLQNRKSRKSDAIYEIKEEDKSNDGIDDSKETLRCYNDV